MPEKVELQSTGAVLYQFRPSRIEPLYHVARYYRENRKWHSCYMFAKMAYDTAYPKSDVLFVEKWIYEFDILDELMVCANWIYHYKESYDIVSCCSHGGGVGG